MATWRHSSTRHSNNQNSISARDLQSNSTIQRRLQNDIESRFPDFFYEIKRGEIGANDGSRTTITNEEAARILLAFDVRQPWSCHQSYKLFDELHIAIFARPEVDADRVVGLYQAYFAVLDVLPRVKPEVLGKYRLVQYFLLSLLRMALESDAVGQRFCEGPYGIPGRHSMGGTASTLLFACSGGFGHRSQRRGRGKGDRWRAL